MCAERSTHVCSNCRRDGLVSSESTHNVDPRTSSRSVVRAGQVAAYAWVNSGANTSVTRPKMEALRMVAAHSTKNPTTLAQGWHDASSDWPLLTSLKQYSNAGCLCRE